MKEPIGIEYVPHISWQITSDLPGIMQESYRIQLSTYKDFSTIVWDSGRIESDCQIQVCVGYDKLKSAMRYYVRVMVWAGGFMSDWSGAVSFVTGLVVPDQWSAPYVSAERMEDHDVSKGTYVRGDFHVDGHVEQAYLFATALGLYIPYMNGQRVSDIEMAPGWTSYNRNRLYQVYEVTDVVQEGKNTVGAMIGCGWYKGVMGLTKARNNYGDTSAVSMEVWLRYADGHIERVYSDKDWIGADAPIVFSEIYDGETYDAAMEIDNWCIPFNDNRVDGRWRTCRLLSSDASILHGQAGGFVRVNGRIPASQLIRTPKGETVVDFGQNMAGRIEVSCSGRAGDVIEIRCFETLDAQGNVYVDNLRKAKTTMRYTFAKDGQICWSPSFTFMGFRYGHILSFPGEPSIENFTALVLHTDMEETGSFSTSNPLVNQLHHNIVWGMKSNFLDVPTDCPQRDERLGWTGDAQIFSRTASYLMNVDTFFRKWLRDLEADQTPEGGVPHVIPNIEEGRTDGNWLLSQGPHSAAAWADAAVIIPWNLYLMYGDTQVLYKQFASMEGWIRFMEHHSEDYIWNYKLQFGDWVALDAKEGSYFGATPNDLTCTAYFAYSTELFAKICHILGKEEKENYYRRLYGHIKEKFIATFFTKEGQLTAQTQTAHIIALHFNLVPEHFREGIANRLTELLAKENGHLVTGFVGTPYFCQALGESGKVREAYELLLKDDFPSWLYQVKMGATTVWEHWDGLKPDGTMWSAEMNSFNHYAYGAIGEWLYRSVAGIDTDENHPGFGHILFRPLVNPAFSEIDCTYKSIRGDITVQWKWADTKTVFLTIQIPCNCTGEVKLPAGIGWEKAENGQDMTVEKRLLSGRYRWIGRL